LLLLLELLPDAVCGGRCCCRCCVEQLLLLWAHVYAQQLVQQVILKGVFMQTACPGVGPGHSTKQVQGNTSSARSELA
jgi:hypothetical protein